MPDTFAVGDGHELDCVSAVVGGDRPGNADVFDTAGLFKKARSNGAEESRGGT